MIPPAERGPGKDPSEVGRSIGPAELERLRLAGLSDSFDPWLSRFARDAWRCGGEVRVVADAAGPVRALYLFHPFEGEASVFTREAALAESLRRLRPGTALYSDFRLGAPSVEFIVYAGPTGSVPGRHRFRHPVRLASAGDRSGVAAVLRQVDGSVDEGWIATASAGSEDCLVVDGSGELAGVGWASRTGGHGRLHSLAVRPAYRRAGIGTDLFFARCAWLRTNGARWLITEIATANAASRAIAEAGALRPVGHLYRSSPEPPGRP